MDRRADMTKLIVALHNFANVPKNGHKIKFGGLTSAPNTSPNQLQQ
jgi:hypothetical protein